MSRQGSGQITVKWEENTAGSVSVIDSNSACCSPFVTLAVDLNLNQSEGHIFVDRLWNEALLAVSRKDFAIPTVHARTLFHTNVAMYDILGYLRSNSSPIFIGKSRFHKHL